MLGWTATKRSPALPDVPTMAEAGYAGINIPGGSFRSISVRKGTPPEVKKKLAGMVRAAFDSPVYQRFMKEQGLTPAYFELEKLDKVEELKQYLPK